MNETYEFHEIANMFPMMAVDEFEQLKQDIETHGLIEPIVLFENKILDGRNRFLACGEAGVKPHYEYYKGDEPVSYVVSKNLHRRHLNETQRGVVAEKIADMKGGERTDLIPIGTKFSMDDAAKKMNVGRTTVARVRKVKQEAPELMPKLESGEMSAYQAVKKIEHKKLQEAKKQEVIKLEDNRPTIEYCDAVEWILEQNECDLLITDPPYKTDVDNIWEFSRDWLPYALDMVKDTGRAYICIGPYPVELAAYLSIKPPEHLILENILVWTYRNTIGPSPTYDYKNNWQAILYYRGVNAPPLNCPVMIEQFTVQDISAPDGRQGDRFHKWQKPDELARRLISHSTKEGDLVLDPFAGTGTFLIAASKMGRIAKGCDLSKEMLDIAKDRGCKVA